MNDLPIDGNQTLLSQILQDSGKMLRRQVKPGGQVDLFQRQPDRHVFSVFSRGRELRQNEIGHPLMPTLEIQGLDIEDQAMDAPGHQPQQSPDQRRRILDQARHHFFRQIQNHRINNRLRRNVAGNPQKQRCLTQAIATFENIDHFFLTISRNLGYFHNTFNHDIHAARRLTREENGLVARNA